MTPITKPNSFWRRLIRKKLHMMGRAAKWKLKFRPDVEVFIFVLEITSQIATWFLFHTVNMGCFVDINTIDYKVKVLSNSSLIFMTANSLFDVFRELIDFFPLNWLVVSLSCGHFLNQCVPLQKCFFEKFEFMDVSRMSG